MSTNKKYPLQGLQFLPIFLILVYKVVIQASGIGHEKKMLILYVFIGISTLIFGYLLVGSRKPK